MKVIFFDMYGVILKESKGKFIPYTQSHFPQSEHDRIKKLFVEDELFTKAGNGEINSYEFLSKIGFIDPVFSMKDYIENHLTVDNDFYSFADKFSNKYRFALLSNDVSDWSKYITEYYGLNKYFPVKIISADVKCRKPDPKIFEIALQIMETQAEKCTFIDNSTDNLYTARNLGMDTILFNRDNEEFDGKIVYSFDELSNIL